MFEESRRIGLVAGWGTFPIVVARHLTAQGKQVVCVGINQHADPELEKICYAYCSVGLGRFGKAVQFLRRHDVRVATMAGKIHKVRLFRRAAWLDLVPDLYGFRTFFPYFISQTRDRRDNTLLGAAVQGFAAKDITMAPATELVPGLLVPSGTLAGGILNKGQRRDIAFGWRLAREMGRLDVGQSVAVKGQAVLAVEAIEGTDECIRRAGRLCPAGGFTVVKVAKPSQDMRFDVPAIGIGTLQALQQAGGGVLAVEANSTILLDPDEVAKFANQHGIHVVALREEEVLSDHGEL
ncbi:MAG: UDP-2,3-diacylglucosamine diphosphatase LpxI [Planctomycetota bacterium]|nr:UDP-2,3-diacylglucosamine diphosphatase LpxI [Planctomycetota bacterium]